MADIGSRLNSGQTLPVGDSLRSNNGDFSLDMQSDGNLVLYGNTDPRKVLWKTKTDGKDIAKCIMQKDGNLVLYRHNEDAEWSTKTDGHIGAYLDLQDDGNLVVYSSSRDKALWDSGTAQ